jgi:hypothetical protein
MSESAAPVKLCHCGRPLHYTNRRYFEIIEEIIGQLGECVRMTADDGRTWLVPRHYIALHGVKNQELSCLGFEEVKGDNRVRPIRFKVDRRRNGPGD